MRIKLLSLISLIILLASCSTTKQDLSYFKNIEDNQYANIDKEYALKIKPDDELLIIVSSEVPEATAIYNNPLINPSERSSTTLSTTPSIMPYVVNSKGNIVMPILGEIHVAGKTLDQLKSLLTAEISKAVKDPMVSVQFKGFRVVILGEVNSPGTKIVDRERYSILDAIGDGGDLSIYGNRDNVLLIREIDGVKTYHRFNLNDANILNSPFYYLQQNDVVYVEPNKIRKDNSKYNQNNAFKLSVISTIVSAASIIASLVIALTVK